MNDLHDLLARVEAAEEMDAALFNQVAMIALPQVLGSSAPENIDHADRLLRLRIGTFRNAGAWVDAVLALYERVLPGWEFTLTVQRPRDAPDIWTAEMGDPMRGWESDGHAAALALAAAMLSALQAQGSPGPRKDGSALIVQTPKTEESR